MPAFFVLAGLLGACDAGPPRRAAEPAVPTASPAPRGAAVTTGPTCGRGVAGLISDGPFERKAIAPKRPAAIAEALAPVMSWTPDGWTLRRISSYQAVARHVGRR